MLESLTRYIGSLSPATFYLALFVSAYIENIFPPVPGDTVTVFAAYIAGRSQRNFAGVLVSTTLGSVAGFMTYYVVGRLIHPEYFVRKDYRFLPAASFESAWRWFQRWGYWIVLLNRFFSGIRSVISIVCGMCRLPWFKVLMLSALGSTIWNGLLIWAAYLLGANWKAIDRILVQYNRVLLAVLAVALVLWLVRKKHRVSRTPR